jgi:hypothetical protein
MHFSIGRAKIHTCNAAIHADASAAVNGSPDNSPVNMVNDGTAIDAPIQLPLTLATATVIDERQNMYDLVKGMALDDTNTTPKSISSKVLQIFEEKHKNGNIIYIKS